MKSLEEISLNYESDKGNVYHGYLSIYEKYFSNYRNTLDNFLEIGLWKGESIKMWREYFNVGNLVGADILDLDEVIEVVLVNAQERSEEPISFWKKVSEEYRTEQYFEAKPL
jgi:hypothetical protein